ncbi:MAG TPA: transcription termination factor NusA [Candidatus Saccharimonadales bacterium]|nr:transcription termination factor NusA [Candidatus Saccharimonadales bacterium]
MAITEFNAALNQVATERGIPVDKVLDSIKTALASAYRKDYDHEATLEEITVDLDPNTGEAKILKSDKDVTPSGFGRIAAQTAKQVILQKIRETEKEVVLDEYKSKLNTIVTGHVFRMENSVVVLDLGKAHGILPQSEQVETEQYRLNQRLKVLIKDIRDSSRGTEIIVSRADPEFIKKLFEAEVPEIASGVVKIEAIAREAGSRTKMAVVSSDEKIDPVGSCVGQKGVRVQAIISEVFGEKIDIIPFSNNTEKFIASSLSPAKVNEVELDQANKRAIVSVPEDQQSLAIGKEGQNARLANKLTRWKIDIKGTAGLFGAALEEKQKDEDKNIVRGVWDADIKEAKEKAEVVEEPVAPTEETPHEPEAPQTETPEAQEEPKEEPKSEN